MMSKEKITAEEKKRLKLSKEEIESKKVMLFEEESKLENLEAQIISQEDSIENELPLKQLEIQIAQIKSQIKMLPYLEKQLSEKRPLQAARNNLKRMKSQLDTAKHNIKVLRKQINTGYA